MLGPGVNKCPICVTIADDGLFLVGKVISPGHEGLTTALTIVHVYDRLNSMFWDVV